MNKILKYLKAEIDVEIFACTHIAVMVIMYGLILWFCGIKEVSFAVLFEMMWLGYAIAWIQKLLFLKEKTYGTWEYRVRKILWCLVPVLLTILTGEIFGWFREVSVWGEVVFYAWIVLYFVLWLAALKYLYQEDTKEMNQLLKQRKKEMSDI